MANYVVIAPRTAATPLVQPQAPVAPLDEAQRAARTGRDGFANNLHAFDAAPSNARFRDSSTPSPMPGGRRAGDPAEGRDSSAYFAQRLSQEGDPDSSLGSQRSAAIAAYTRARDSHIEFLPSFQALDIRV